MNDAAALTGWSLFVYLAVLAVFVVAALVRGRPWKPDPDARVAPEADPTRRPGRPADREEEER